VPLVEPDLLAAHDPAKLIASLAGIDELWRARAAIADARRERWVYRASFAQGRARIAPERVSADHAFARLAPCENALSLHSAYYCAAPLFISGPGAGVDLTAAGVYADVLVVARRHAPVESRSLAVRASAAVEVAA
jgi:homoserine dehydrogenase